MEDAFFDTLLYREFVQLYEIACLPDESTILLFRHRLAKYKLAKYKLAEQILATANELLTHLGLLLKACTAGYICDFAKANTLLHGQVRVAFGDAGCQGIEMRLDTKSDGTRHVAMRSGKRKALNKENEVDAVIDKTEKHKAWTRTKVAHQFRVVKRQLGFVKVRYRGLKKSTAQLFTLIAISHLWIVRVKLIGTGKLVRPQTKVKRRQGEKAYTGIEIERIPKEFM